MPNDNSAYGKYLAWFAFAAASLGGSGALAYHLFEPVWVHTSGWSAMPETTGYPSVTGIEDLRYSNAVRNAQIALEESRQKMQAPALSAAVAIGGEVVWSSATGFANLEDNIPVNVTSRFRLGSTSKAVTSVAAGTLIDQGRLELDAAIQTYVPYFPEKKWPVGLRQVMSHRAGLRDYSLCFCFPIWEHLNRRRFDSVGESISVISDSPLLFEPDTNFAYTSLGYNLVGAAIEGASGKPYTDYLREAVFTPLGMKSTGLDSVSGAEVGRTGFYEVEAGKYKRAYPVDNSIRWPSGGLLSTPSDMVRLGSAMIEPGLLSEEVQRELVTVPEGGSDARGAGHYALGWRASDWTLFNGDLTTPSYHHGGTAVGSTSILVVFPEYGMVVSTMMNKGGSDANDLAAATDRIAEAFIGAQTEEASPAQVN